MDTKNFYKILLKILLPYHPVYFTLSFFQFKFLNLFVLFIKKGKIIKNGDNMEKSETLTQLRREVENLKKKIFIFETLQSEKEIKAGKVDGPFKTAKELLKRVKE